MKFLTKDETVILPDWDYNPSKLRKVTGTRFGALCGINPWSTPFQAWCEITKAAKPPFVDTIYMQAGRVIEPKIIDWLKTQFGSDRVVSPAEHFKRDTSNVYDFYPNEEIFGGMWDALLLNKAGKPIGVFEIKTTKRVEDWLENPPLYYLAQAFLYTRLLGLNKAIMVLCVMDEQDYKYPEQKVVDSCNTYTFMYDIDDKENCPIDIDALMETATKLWKTHVITGCSPQFDEKKDDEYLTILRTANINVDEDINAVLSALTEVSALINKIRTDNNLDELEKRENQLKDQLKELFKQQMSESDKYVELGGWKLTKSEPSISYDVKGFIKENPQFEEALNAYKTTKQPTYRFTKTKN